MTKDEAKIRRAGYRAGWVQGKRDRKTDVDKCLAELMQALRVALDDTDLTADHPSAITMTKYENKIKPKQIRTRKICKGSIVRWENGNLFEGGVLTKFVRYEHGAGEWWEILLTPSGDAVERLITISMITKFGPKR